MQPGKQQCRGHRSCDDMIASPGLITFHIFFSCLLPRSTLAFNVFIDKCIVPPSKTHNFCKDLKAYLTSHLNSKAGKTSFFKKRIHHQWLEVECGSCLYNHQHTNLLVFPPLIGSISCLASVVNSKVVRGYQHMLLRIRISQWALFNCLSFDIFNQKHFLQLGSLVRVLFVSRKDPCNEIST